MAWTEDEYAALLARGQVREVGAKGPRMDQGRLRTFRGTKDADGVKDRFRSQTERRYAAYLDGEVNAGMVDRWYYEPFKGLYLAPETSYTPDFLISYCDGTQGLVFHEVKGAFIRQKDWIKLKMAAVLYPVFPFVLAQWKDGAWRWQDVPAS